MKPCKPSLSKLPQSKLSQSKLSMAMSGVLALLAQASYASDEPIDLGELTVSAYASKDGLMSSYAGGQLAKGGRTGILGNKHFMDNPYSLTSYTNQFIENSQADSVGDVLKKDPSVRVARGFGNFQESYLIRGFVTNSDDTMFNGLYGILPRQYIASELFERVEIQKGANSFANGIAPGGSNKGGTVALLPKRAGNHDFRRLTLGYGAGSRGEISADLSQRFGANDAFGVRANLVYKDGDTAVDKEQAKLGLLALGLDYHADTLRLSADLGYQNNELSQTRTNVTLTNLTQVPNAPDAKKNWAMPWSYSNEKDVFGTLRAEYDFGKTTVYGAYGFRQGDEANSLANLTINQPNGDGTTYRFDNTREDTIHTGEIGIKGRFHTGSMAHNWVLAANHFNLKKKNAYAMDFRNTLATNLYTPTFYSQPNWSANTFLGATLDNPIKTQDTTLQSVALGDSISLFDGKLQTTIGARYQKIDDKGYSYTGSQTSHYKDDAITPTLGLIYALNDETAIYANYAESLQKGETAPTTASNAGAVMSPYVTKQYELGLKYDTGAMGASFALFNIDKPRYTVNQGVFGEKGQNNHAGLEASIFGSPSDNSRILAGFSYLNTRQKQTGNATTEGKQVIGIAQRQANLGLEYDLPFVEGLTLTGDVIYTGKRYANDANTLAVGGATTYNLGARYQTKLFGKPTTVRATAENITGKDYWASVGGYENLAGNNGSGYLTMGQPMSVKLSATFEF